jgi:hypothetical protein
VKGSSAQPGSLARCPERGLVTGQLSALVFQYYGLATGLLVLGFQRTSKMAGSLKRAMISSSIAILQLKPIPSASTPTALVNRTSCSASRLTKRET